MKQNQSAYHVSVVGVEGLIDERKLVRSKLLLTVDQLGKLGKIGFSNKACVTSVSKVGRYKVVGRTENLHGHVTSVMLQHESKIAQATLAAQCTHHSVYTRLC